MEKGVCNLIQKYSPEAVRERALSSPTASFQILVSIHQSVLFARSVPAEVPAVIHHSQLAANMEDSDFDSSAQDCLSSVCSIAINCVTRFPNTGKTLLRSVY